MGRGRWVTGAAVLAATAVLAQPGCSVSEQGVLVVGHDERGTLVVGATFCTSDGSDPIDNITVTHGGRGPDLWAIGLPRHDPDEQAVEPPPAPDDPRPGTLDIVTMVAVGDPDPPFGSLVVALEDPLPSGPLTVEAYGTDPWDPSIAELTVAVEGEPDTYQVARGEDGVESGLGAEAAAEVVEGYCADAGGDILVAGVVSTLVATGVVGVGFAVVVVVAVRQYRRAGARVAEVAGGQTGP